MSNTIAELALVLSVMSPFDTDANPKDVLCLAQNIYHEARFESIEGQQAVAYVTLNRVSDSRYPDSVCKVVYQTKTRKGREIAQFSWVTDEPKVDLVNPIERAAFEWAIEIAAQSIHSYNPDNEFLSGAKFYYNPEKADPKWADSMWEVATIGNHVFLIDEE